MGRATSLPNVTSVQSSICSFCMTSVHKEETHLSTLCCIGLTFLWSKAIILKIKTRLAILCGMLLSGVSDVPRQRQRGTSNPQTHYLPSILRTVMFSDIHWQITISVPCSLLPPELHFKLQFIFREKQERSTVNRFFDLCKYKAVNVPSTASSYTFSTQVMMIGVLISPWLYCTIKQYLCNLMSW